MRVTKDSVTVIKTDDPVVFTYMVNEAITEGFTDTFYSDYTRDGQYVSYMKKVVVAS